MFLKFREICVADNLVRTYEVSKLALLACYRRCIFVLQGTHIKVNVFMPKKLVKTIRV